MRRVDLKSPVLFLAVHGGWSASEDWRLYSDGDPGGSKHVG